MRRLISLLVVMFLMMGCSATPAVQTPFERQEVRGLGDPEVVVVNMTNRTITVDLSGAATRSLTIAAMQTARATVPRGDYVYRASTKGATPFEGTDTFEPDGRYTWSFVIKRLKPAPSASLVAALDGALLNGVTRTTRFEGAFIGGPASSVPPGGAPDGKGWTMFEPGWDVLVEGGRVTTLRFTSNVLGDLMLFDRADMVAKLGQPDGCKPMTSGATTMELCLYTKTGAAFFIDPADKSLRLLVISEP